MKLKRTVGATDDDARGYCCVSIPSQRRNLLAYRWLNFVDLGCSGNSEAGMVKSKKRTKSRKPPRAMALTSSEPKLRGRRQKPTDSTKQPRTTPSATIELPTQLHEISPIWLPGVFLLRQQVLLARGFLSMMEAQQQFARLWPLALQRTTRVD